MVNAAIRVIDKSGVNYVFANDLAQLRNGNANRLVITHSGLVDIAEGGAQGIVRVVKQGLYFRDIWKRAKKCEGKKDTE